MRKHSFRRVSLLLASAGIAIAGVMVMNPAAQAAPSTKSNPVTCYSGSTGDCVRKGSSFTLANGTDEYSIVYVEAQSLGGKKFSEITELGFHYAGAVSGGSPRYSIPITSGTDNGYVFIDAATCNDGLGNVAPLTDPSCAVSGYHGATNFSYDSWAAFLAEPNAVVGTNATFIIADQPGTVTVSDVKLSRTPPGKIS